MQHALWQWYVEAGTSTASKQRTVSTLLSPLSSCRSVQDPSPQAGTPHFTKLESHLQVILGPVTWRVSISTQCDGHSLLTAANTVLLSLHDAVCGPLVQLLVLC